ncbi:hypothetical protein A2217_05190 [Candidatus Peribacteria bacterium RIFOXYA2_FULL_55_28]|nr:MAG: hypothetical protein UY85_C0002G0011 [Candidatus Peribacteria bacterium GW2011_GWB1_54_5]KKW42191.1 MAG: hypothetical protein UY90_C0040G0012 [Candidatus Peregrinibacteria bacterium GW2011_GWA2_54_9]OGJ71287.1 MAG: hypothetical protein A2198_05795 [Candidatus Peribacteria bacterium RIFOXYA1_FULL_56_14]OGJ75095.1 MAG: hypothetical protein A2217_05190 [Candidatus Peribacteria bacterium RIFOXYA2_FULL_55_28]OGJ75988.1 MAG: hypothetical protein A2327_03755 [Candidatus Peribacteria bacterium 
MMEEHVHCRKAVPGDEHAVSALAKRLEIHEGDDPSLAMHRGFLFYAKPEEVYRQRFSISQYCFIAEQEGEIVGALVAHDRGELEELGASLKYPRALVEYLFSLQYPHWIYIDELAVHPGHQHHGIGQHLYDFAFGNVPGSVLLAGISHDPIPNEASLHFFTKNGHTLLTELQEGEWLCGIYGRTIT